MMRWLVERALRLRLAVVALALVLIVAGSRAAQNTPLDVFPEFAPPLVEIQTEAPGLSTGEVESLVTVPLENALNGVPDLRTLRSKSVLGLSSVVLIFEEGTELMAARQLVQERLLRIATSLPTVARPPVILSPLSSLSRVMKIGVTSERLSQMELTTLARWTIRPRLMAIPGVANVAIWGQRDRQLQVLVDPDRLRGQQRHPRRCRDRRPRRDGGGGRRIPGHAAPTAGDCPLPRRFHGRRSQADHRAAGHGQQPRRRRRGRRARVLERAAPRRRGRGGGGVPTPIGDAVINAAPACC